MKTALRSALVLGIVLALAAGVHAAPDPAFDFTGHWTGSGTEDNGTPQAITADLVSTAGTRDFTGTVTIEDDPTFTCNVAGKQKAHHMKVKIHLACDNGGVLRLHATLDAGTQALTG